MGVTVSRLRAVSSSWRLRISIFRRVSSPCGISMGVGDAGWREVAALYVLPGGVDAFLGEEHCFIIRISTFSAFGVAAGVMILCVS